jgi:hypothetical protein
VTERKRGREGDLILGDSGRRFKAQVLHEYIAPRCHLRHLCTNSLVSLGSCENVQKSLISERECCLLVLDSVTSTPQWIRQPKPRDVSVPAHLRTKRFNLIVHTNTKPGIWSDLCFSGFLGYDDFSRRQHREKL